MFFNVFIFDPNWRFCKGYSPCIIEIFFDFGTLVIFRLLGFFGVYFCRKQFCCASTDIFRIFFTVLIFHPKWRFCKNYSPCIIAIFSDFGALVIFRLLGFFGVYFCREQFSCGSRDVLHVLECLNFLPQINDFAKAIARALWQIFRILNSCYFSSIRRYLEWIFA